MLGRPENIDEKIGSGIYKGDFAHYKQLYGVPVGQNLDVFKLVPDELKFSSFVHKFLNNEIHVKMIPPFDLFMTDAPVDIKEVTKTLGPKSPLKAANGSDTAPATPGKAVKAVNSLTKTSSGKRMVIGHKFTKKVNTVYNAIRTNVAAEPPSDPQKLKRTLDLISYLYKNNLLKTIKCQDVMVKFAIKGKVPFFKDWAKREDVKVKGTGGLGSCVLSSSDDKDDDDDSDDEDDDEEDDASAGEGKAAASSTKEGRKLSSTKNPKKKKNKRKKNSNERGLMGLRKSDHWGSPRAGQSLIEIDPPSTNTRSKSSPVPAKDNRKCAAAPSQSEPANKKGNTEVVDVDKDDTPPHGDTAPTDPNLQAMIDWVQNGVGENGVRLSDDARKSVIAALVKQSEDEAIKRMTMNDLKRINDLENARKAAHSDVILEDNESSQTNATMADAKPDKTNDLKEDGQEESPANATKDDAKEGANDNGSGTELEEAPKDHEEVKSDNEKGQPGEENPKETTVKETTVEEKDSNAAQSERNGMGGTDEFERCVIWLPNASIRTKLFNLFKSKSWPNSPECFSATTFPDT